MNIALALSLVAHRTLLPGPIDCHTHLRGDLEGDWVHRGVDETAAGWALRALLRVDFVMKGGAVVRRPE